MRLRRVLFAICIIVLTMFVSVNGAEFKHGVLRYKILNDEITITGCDPNAAMATIPEKIGKYPVTAIGSGAFYGLQIGSVTIPDTVTVIRNSAFNYCTNLKKVTIPESVVSIGRRLRHYT